MRTSSYKQFEIIRADSPEDFTDRLNRRLFDLRHNWPDVSFGEEGQYLIARISYMQHDRVPEDLGDAYEMQNVKFTCQDCPMFKPIRNKNGEPNLRVKYGNCPYAEYGRTYKESRCCDMLYSLLRTGKIYLCLADDDEEDKE